MLMEDGQQNKLKKELKFLENFSEKEFLLNGHKKEQFSSICVLYLEILELIKEGTVLELGCGTGVLASFLFCFSREKIIPYGIDKDLKKIIIAKINNPKFENNFFVGNIFKFDYTEISSFDFVLAFIPSDIKIERLNRLLKKLVNLKKGKRIIIYSYDYDLTNLKSPHNYSNINLTELNVRIENISENYIEVLLT